MLFVGIDGEEDSVNFKKYNCAIPPSNEMPYCKNSFSCSSPYFTKRASSLLKISNAGDSTYDKMNKRKHLVTTKNSSKTANSSFPNNNVSIEAQITPQVIYNKYKVCTSLSVKTDDRPSPPLLARSNNDQSPDFVCRALFHSPNISDTESDESTDNFLEIDSFENGIARTDGYGARDDRLEIEQLKIPLSVVSPDQPATRSSINAECENGRQEDVTVRTEQQSGLPVQQQVVPLETCEFFATVKIVLPVERCSNKNDSSVIGHVRSTIHSETTGSVQFSDTLCFCEQDDHQLLVAEEWNEGGDATDRQLTPIPLPNGPIKSILKPFSREATTQCGVCPDIATDASPCGPLLPTVLSIAAERRGRGAEWVRINLIDSVDATQVRESVQMQRAGTRPLNIKGTTQQIKSYGYDGCIWNVKSNKPYNVLPFVMTLDEYFFILSEECVQKCHLLDHKKHKVLRQKFKSECVLKDEGRCARLNSLNERYWERMRQQESIKK